MSPNVRVRMCVRALATTIVFFLLSADRGYTASSVKASNYLKNFFKFKNRTENLSRCY